MVKRANKSVNLDGRRKATVKNLEGAPAQHAAGRYLLRLYVAGNSARSERALRNAKAICEDYLNGRYQLEVIDVYQQPGKVRGDQVVAAPTLVKQLPVPLRRLIGDLSDKQQVLICLDLTEKSI